MKEPGLDGRHRDKPDREQRDRSQIRTEVPEPGEERRRVEERRQDPDEHDFRRQREVRHPRHEAEQQAPRNEQDRQRQSNDRRRDEHDPEVHEQREQLQLAVGREMHAARLDDGSRLNRSPFRRSLVLARRNPGVQGRG